ncbi:MAG: hypothetical protein E5V21_05965 [Mesorhizobium sp.]|nr:MAG: hypothetical protein E5V21_05965 [Mesorhizobium sp.]
MGEGGRAKLGRMRGVPAWHRRSSVQHPSTVLALCANPPSPTRGEGKKLLNQPTGSPSRVAHRRGRSGWLGRRRARCLPA